MFCIGQVKQKNLAICFLLMRQMQIDPESVINVPLTGAAKALHPIVFKEGDSFCALLGPDPQAGIFGCGSTPKSALTDWDEHLKEHLATAGDDDEIVQHVKGVLSKPKEEKPMSHELAHFLSEAIRPPRK
jgi:hypothetical protein